MAEQCAGVFYGCLVPALPEKLVHRFVIFSSFFETARLASRRIDSRNDIVSLEIQLGTSRFPDFSNLDDDDNDFRKYGLVIMLFPTMSRVHLELNVDVDSKRAMMNLVFGNVFAVGDLGNVRHQTPFIRFFPVRKAISGISSTTEKTSSSLPCIKCAKKDDRIEGVSVERPPYYSYMDSTSGQLEPASGARASIPGQEYWPEGTANRVRAARAPAPTGKSEGKPSYGKNPGSRRKKRKGSVAASGSSDQNVVSTDPPTNSPVLESSDDISEEHKDVSTEYVVYQKEQEKEYFSPYELDKELGRPHPFIDPEKKKPLENILPNEELWWNWQKPDNEIWSRWQRPRPCVERVFAKAMAETGQIKLYGKEPTETECALVRTRRHVFKEERLKEEKERLERIGPVAYYSEWVKAWDRDTSREAVQKHFEETGEDENDQLIEMFQHQTDGEFRIMMGTDIRIRRDPLAMRMREDLIKEIWGGDPVYPTINYIQDPKEVIDYRGANFHEPTPNIVPYLMEHGKMISREELEQMLARQKTEQLEMTDMDEAMEQAVDIGENDTDVGCDTIMKYLAKGFMNRFLAEVAEFENNGWAKVCISLKDEGEDSDMEGEDEAEEKITRNWSVLKTTPQLSKSKDKKKKKKDEPMTLEDAVEDSENLTDFLLDFDEE
ncbi:hmr,ptac12 [Asimina triloba]